MNINMYTTVDQGHLHIAYKNFYQDRITVYENAITKFFSYIFGVSTEISFDGKAIYVNKKEYIRLLNDWGKYDTKNLDQYRYLKSFDINPIKNRGLMRQYLSAQKVNKLGTELVEALVNKNTDLVFQKLGEGADPDIRFWIRGYGNHAVTDTNLTGKTGSLGTECIDKFKDVLPEIESLWRCYTPILFFAEKSLPIDSLIEFGAHKDLRGLTFFHKQEKDGQAIYAINRQVQELFFDSTSNSIKSSPYMDYDKHLLYGKKRLD